jgi:hypothetical protein
MKRIWQWLKDSNRLKHLVGGVAVGLGANDWYCAEYVGIGVAGSLEFKDYQWGGKPDWIDFTLTFVGVNIGYTIRYFVYG